jgi:hypothetical protein
MSRMPSAIELHELTSAFLPEPVEYALVTPPGYRESDPIRFRSACC